MATSEHFVCSHVILHEKSGGKMEAKRKTCFDQLRHRNVSSIDELKLRLRKVYLFVWYFNYWFHNFLNFFFCLQLYIADLKCKRNKILNGKREIDITEEEEAEFYRNFCRIHFSQYGDPWDAEEDLLSRIWEEIKVES